MLWSSLNWLQTAQLFLFLREIWWLVASAKEFNIHQIKLKNREQIHHPLRPLIQILSSISPLSCQRRNPSGRRATHRTLTRLETQTISHKVHFPGLTRVYSLLLRNRKIMCKIMDKQVKYKIKWPWTLTILLIVLKDSRRSLRSSEGAALAHKSLSQPNKSQLDQTVFLKFLIRDTNRNLILV